MGGTAREDLRLHRRQRFLVRVHDQLGVLLLDLGP